MKTQKHILNTPQLESVSGVKQAPLLGRGWGRTIFLILFIIAFTTASAQVGIGTTTPDASALLDVTSTEKGFLPPRLTTDEREAIVSPAKGLMVYNISLSCLQVNDGTPTAPVWNCISNIAGVPDGGVTSIDCNSATNNGQLVEGVTASGVSSVISYTGGNGGPYSGQVVSSTGVTGLTATLPAGAYANGSGTLTFTITGTPSSGGTASFAINIGGQSCTLTRVVWTVGPDDLYNPITGKIWMDRNLGATQAATSPSDAAAYGDLYQWGRATEGHEKRTSPNYSDVLTTAEGVSNFNPTTGSAWYGRFIRRNSTTQPNNWVNFSVAGVNDLWQGLNGTNNPCPSGYRVPTEADWQAEIDSWTTQNIAGAYASLKFTYGGARERGTGNINGLNTNGEYWTSTTVPNGTARMVQITAGTLNNRQRADGRMIRCIKY